MIVRRVYRFRLEPTADQEAVFRRMAGARRWVWNWALGRCREHYTATGKGLSRGALSAELTGLKSEPDTSWLKEVDSQALQQALIDLYKAFDAFFAKRARAPRFKVRKRDAVRFRIPQRVAVVGDAVSVPKVGLVKARISRAVEGVTKSATFKRDACGHWFVSLVAAVEMPAVTLPRPSDDRTVGVDLGLQDAVVTSDGDRVAAPRFYRTTRRKLRRAQRAFSRKQKGSSNKAKARERVARIHQTIANKRADFCHKLTTALVTGHDAVCIEDLHVRGLARTKLSTSMMDASMGTIRWQLAYKGVWHRVHIVAVDRFYPSSKLCHACGHTHDGLTLSDRVWACPSCGVVLDRDLNAARNIKREGLRMLAVGHTESENACGVGVRLPMAAAGGEARILAL